MKMWQTSVRLSQLAVKSPAIIPSRRARLTAGVATALALVLLFGCQPIDQGTQLASVGEYHITVEDFELAALEHPLLSANTEPEAKREVLDELIDRALLILEAQDLELDQDPEYVNAETETRRTVLLDALYDALVKDLARNSEAEVQKLWEMRSQEWRVSQLFANNMGEVRRAIHRLERGEEFDEVARTSSIEPGAVSPGGDLGFVTAGELPSQVEEVLWSLDIGEWGGPIPMPIGYYLVRLTDTQAREQPPYGEVRCQLDELLRIRKERALVTDFVTRLKKRHGLREVASSFELLAERWQNRTTEELLASRGDPHGLGFTDEELALPLVEYQGGAYRISELFQGLYESSTMERPPSSNDPLLRLFIEDRVVDRLLFEYAEEWGVERRPQARRALRLQRESALINALYEQMIVPSAVVTEEERQKLRSAAGQPGAAGQNTTELETELFQEKRQNALRELLIRLRGEYPPTIDEEVFSRVPWPVTPQEKA